MAGSQNRRKAAVTTSRSAGQASTAAVLLTAAAVAGWFWWRKRKEQEEQNPQKRKAKTLCLQAAGGRSAFRFPGLRSGGSSSNKGTSSGKQPGSSSFAFPSVHAAQQQPQPKGNPKKDKALRRQRKQEKQARKQSKDAMEAISAKAGADDDGPKTIKYVDMSKTSDSYDKVREWQETGKKRYP